MEGTRSNAVAPQPPPEEDVDAPRRSSVFKNIRVVAVSPRLSDARASRQHSSSLRATPETAVVAPYPLDLSGEFQPRTLQSVDEESDAAVGIPSKRDAFGFPTPLTPRQPSQLEKTFSMFGYSLAPLYDLWERQQVSHCGQYSVERMLALDEYCQRTSFQRVLVVCVLMPLIPLLLIVLMELVPLRPIEAGASANYAFWARHALTLWLTALCVEGQAKSWIPELPLSTNQALVIASGTAVATTGLEMLTAEFWVFPVPFLAVLGSSVFWLSWAVMARVVLGPNPVQAVQDANFRVLRFLQITAVQSSLLGIYPAYQIIFAAVNRFVELLVVSLLPVINVALKNTLVACGSHLEDNLPEMVVFTVDGFSALYSVICMRGTNSLKMVAATVAINVLVMVLSLHGMNRRSRAARESRSYHLLQLLQRQAQRTPSFLTSSSAGGSPELLSTLVLTTLKMLRTPGQLDPAELRQIRLLSGKQHKLSSANTALLQSLAARCVYHNDRKISETISMSQMKSRYASAAIEGRVLSPSHFTAPPPRQSRLTQRLRAALRALPEAGRKLGSGIESGLTGFPSFRSASRENPTKKSDADAGTDSFPRLSSVARLARLMKASSHRISDRTASPKKPPRVAMDQDTSAKLRTLVMPGSPVISDVLLETRKQNTRAVKQALQLLFNSEYLGLTAYTLFIIPMLYVLYMPILQALPNEVYYPSHFVLMENADQFLDRMTVIAILAFLQLAVLIVLHVFVATRFAVSTIYQIAFVLETHFTLVAGRLLVSFIFAVQSTLLHYGADFSFRFSWIHR